LLSSLSIWVSSPYGLKSMMECLSRATLLSQPEDIPDFLTKYMSGLINFRDSGHETDPKLLCFQSWFVKALVTNVF
uniref:Uncharacterized protein n=1 Tax=Anabas testudineus TaxID=64144 RepID=A0AAQ6IHA8_ANATE